MAENTSESRGASSDERKRYRLLLEITDLVARAKNLPDAFKEIAPPVLALTGAELLNLSLHDPHQDCMVTHYWKKNEESGEFESFPVDEAATGWVWKHQEPMVISDIRSERRFSKCVPVLLNHGVRSYTVIPVSTPAQHFGALGLGKNVAETLNEDDVEFLSRIALMGALALEKNKYYRLYEEQQSLAEISRELSSNLEIEQLLPSILSSLRSIARYDRAVLSLLSEDDKNVYVYGDALEWEAVLNHGRMVPLAEELSARAVQARRVTFLTAADLRDIKTPLATAMVKSGVRSVCSVPLITDDKIWGALNLSNMEENAFGGPEVEYIQQVTNQIAMALQNAHAYREIAQLKARLVEEKRYLESDGEREGTADRIVGDSVLLKRVLDHAAIVAATDSTVLITGETGTGKERIARMIHNISQRHDRNFVKLNCAAIPSGLLESELFGHEKGAFTGAVSQKLGRLELADKGTLFLDEIGEIPLEIQPKLLRVLQDHEFERLGGTRTIRVNVRLIAATNRDLLQAVEDKEFRSDLFYRLHVFPLHMPPLRDRSEDIPVLVRHFVDKCSVRLHKRIEFIPDEAIEAMLHWSWPGNIRELENLVERSVILSPGNTLHVPLAELRQETAESGATPDETLRGKEREHIIEALRQSHGLLSGPSGAAARLGLKRTTLQYKMQKLGISRIHYLG